MRLPDNQLRQPHSVPVMAGVIRRRWQTHACHLLYSFDN